MIPEREEHWIAADGGIALHAWIFRPVGAADPAPAVTIASGFGGLAEAGLMRFAEHFAGLGLVSIIHDHRGFGLSGGWPRQDIDPWRQILDWRRVITYLQDVPGVDPERIGLLGSSYAGGHALVLAGSDPRIKAVVAQIPTISGYEQGKRRNPSPEATRRLQERFNADERAQLRGAEPDRQLLVSTDPDVPSAYKDPAMVEHEGRFPVGELARYDHMITLRSTLKAQMYDPGVWVDRIAPTPLLMIVGTKDTVTPTDLALRAFERAGEPKKLITYEGGHFDAYIEQFDRTGSGSGDWFVEHLHPVVRA
ncbi:alpha/beta hydrolase [Streptomyces sp. NPDC090080]|uniref:alpha/beta hydrolase n=1 Tax=Streptomyces sp. NPDC090080 TaxID=3365939 RepID=UPI0038226A90